MEFFHSPVDELSRVHRNHNISKCSSRIRACNGRHLHLDNLIERIVLEYKLLKASTRHLFFAISYVTTVVWVALSISPSGPLLFRQSIREDFTPAIFGHDKASVEPYEWLNSVCIPTLHSKYILTTGSTHPIVLVWPTVSISSVEDASSILHGNLSSALNSSVSNLSVVMDVVFTLYSHQAQSVAIVTTHLGDSGSELLISVYNPWSNRILLLSLGAVCLGVSLLSLILDVRELVKRYRLTGRFRLIKIYSLFNTLSIPTIIGLRIFWFEYVLALPDRLSRLLSATSDVSLLLEEFDEFANLKTVNSLIQCLTVTLVGAASIRLFRILSAHPRTEVLIAVVRNAKVDLMHFFITTALVLAYFSGVWWMLAGRDLLEIVEWLIQVPFAQWSFEPGNTLLLIIYGIVAYHFLLNYLLMIVASAFGAYREKMSECLVTHTFLIDIFFAIKRLIWRIRTWKRWPHRLVILYALCRVRDTRRKGAPRGHISKAEFVAALKHVSEKGVGIVDDSEPEFGDKYEEQTKRFRSKLVIHHKSAMKWDQSANDTVWEWYESQFGKSFLKPVTRAQIEEDQLEHELLMHEKTVHLNRDFSNLSDLQLSDLARLSKSLKKLTLFA